MRFGTYRDMRSPGVHTAVVQIVWNVKCCVTYAAVRGEGQQVANLSHIKFFRSGTLKLTECTRVQNYTGTAAATIITSTSLYSRKPTLVRYRRRLPSFALLKSSAKRNTDKLAGHLLPRRGGGILLNANPKPQRQTLEWPSTTGPCWNSEK